MKCLPYRLQVDTFGGLAKSIERTLRSDKDRGAAMPFDRRPPQTRDGVGLTAGACNALSVSEVRQTTGQISRRAGRRRQGKVGRRYVENRLVRIALARFRSR